VFRAFSAAGFIYKETRARLTTEHIKERIIIRDAALAALKQEGGAAAFLQRLCDLTKDDLEDGDIDDASVMLVE
jgi:hypothetical protein